VVLERATRLNRTPPGCNMSKRKEPDAPGARGSGKRKLVEEDDDIGEEQGEFEGLLEGLGEDEGEGEDVGEMDALLADDLPDDEYDEELQQTFGRQDSEISEVPESESEEAVEIPFEEDELKSNEKLDLSGHELSNAQARRVAALIAENDALTTIQFGNHELSLSDLTEEEELEWDSEEYTDVEVIIIAELLKKDDCEVKRLDLARNQISDAGAKALAQMLEASSKLEYLNLESNMISEKGGAAFMNAMPVNSTLQYLNLMYNSIPSTRQQELRDSWQQSGRGQLGIHL